MKQRELEMRLQKLEGFPKPRADLEQYMTPAKIAADMLYTAHGLGDIEGKRVIDLGCGTGVFAIGARLLGAAEVTGLDIDEGALDAARRNAAQAGCDIGFLLSPVEAATGHYDTCLMNPPFGAQNRHADIPFLEKAMALADVTYSLHSSETLDFLRKKVGDTGGSVDLEKSYKFEIRHTFEFHRKDRAFFDVTLLRILSP